MDRAHAGQPGVECQQQVHALLGPHLPYEQPARPHPQALLHEVAQRDLAGSLQPGLPGLHGHPVGVGEAQHKPSLGTDTENPWLRDAIDTQEKITWPTARSSAPKAPTDRKNQPCAVLR